MGSVVVDNQMHVQGLVCLCIELLQKLEEFVVTMVWQTFTDNSSLVDIESSKQGGCVVVLVIMSHGARLSCPDNRITHLNNLHLPILIDT